MTLAPERPLTVEPAVEDDGYGPSFEIVNGEKVEKIMSFESQIVGGNIGFELSLHLRETGIGGIAVTEPFIVCFDWMPTTKRRPDVAYWRREQYPNGVPPRGDAAIAPALAVEVLSPGENAFELDTKLAEYFRAGVELVWVVNPKTRTVRAEQPDGSAHVYRDGEELPGSPVLPDFRVPIAKLFPKVDR